MCPARRVLAMLATVVAVLAVPTAAWAKFSAASTRSMSISTQTLDPPSNVTTIDCRNGLAHRYITVDWTATPDTYATGYTVTLTPASGPPIVTSVSGRTTTEALVDAQTKTTYSVTVVAGYLSWTSTPAAAPGPANC